MDSLNSLSSERRRCARPHEGMAVGRAKMVLIAVAENGSLAPLTSASHPSRTVRPSALG
jgi:hypothetical protein